MDTKDQRPCSSFPLLVNGIIQPPCRNSESEDDALLKCKSLIEKGKQAIALETQLRLQYEPETCGSMVVSQKLGFAFMVASGGLILFLLGFRLIRKAMKRTKNDQKIVQAESELDDPLPSRGNFEQLEDLRDEEGSIRWFMPAALNGSPNKERDFIDKQNSQVIDQITEEQARKLQRRVSGIYLVGTVQTLGLASQLPLSVFDGGKTGQSSKFGKNDSELISQQHEDEKLDSFRNLIGQKEFEDDTTADLQIALEHGKASRVKKLIRKGSENNRKVCECSLECDQYVPAPEDYYTYFETKTDSLAHLGIGYPLHFFVQWYLVKALLFVCVLYCLPIITSNFLIYSDMIQASKAERKNYGILVFGSYFEVFQLRLVYGFDFGAWINYNYWFIVSCIQVALLILTTLLASDVATKAEELEGRITTQACPVKERTLYITNIPQQTSPQELEAQLKDRWSTIKLESFTINHIFDIVKFKFKMDSLIRLANYRIKILKWREAMKQHGLTNEYFAGSGFSPKVLPFKLEKSEIVPYPTIESRKYLIDRQMNLLKVNKLLQKKQASLHRQLQKDKKETGKAFITFGSKSDADVIYALENSICFKCRRSKNQFGSISVSRAPAPQDYIWEHASVSGCSRFGRRLLTVLIALIITIADFGALVIINLQKSNVRSRETRRYWQSTALSIAVAFCVILTNELGNLVLDYFINEEKYETNTELVIEKVKVITVFKFINSAIVPMAAAFFSVATFPDQFTAGGLLDDIAFILIYYALLHQLWYLIDPKSLLKWFRKKSLKRSQQESPTMVKMNQTDAEFLFEGPVLDLLQHVHDTVFVLWVAMFYLGVLPIGVVAPLIAFGTNAMYVKYRLLNHHKVPTPLDASLVRIVTINLPWMVYCASGMQLLYIRWAAWYMQNLQIKQKDIVINSQDIAFLKKFSFWFFIACSAYMVLPLRKIFGLCNKSVQESDDCYQETFADISKPGYDCANPLTVSQGRIHILQKLINKLNKEIISRGEAPRLLGNSIKSKRDMSMPELQIRRLQELIEVEKVNQNLFIELQDYCFQARHQNPIFNAQMLVDYERNDRTVFYDTPGGVLHQVHSQQKQPEPPIQTERQVTLVTPPLLQAQDNIPDFRKKLDLVEQLNHEIIPERSDEFSPSLSVKKTFTKQPPQTVAVTPTGIKFIVHSVKTVEPYPVITVKASVYIGKTIFKSEGRPPLNWTSDLCLIEETKRSSQSKLTQLHEYKFAKEQSIYWQEDFLQFNRQDRDTPLALVVQLLVPVPASGSFVCKGYVITKLTGKNNSIDYGNFDLNLFSPPIKFESVNAHSEEPNQISFSLVQDPNSTKYEMPAQQNKIGPDIYSLFFKNGTPQLGEVIEEPESESAITAANRQAEECEIWKETDTRGCDVYIDGLQNLPYNVLVVQMLAKVVDSDQTVIAGSQEFWPELSTSSCKQQHFNAKIEIRKRKIPLTSCVSLTFVTIDMSSGYKCLLGTSSFPLFLDTKTSKPYVPSEKPSESKAKVDGKFGPPSAYASCMLNVGAFKLAINSGVDKPKIPCAAVKIRVDFPPTDHEGTIVSLNDTDESKRLLAYKAKPVEIDETTYSSAYLGAQGQSSIERKMMKRAKGPDQPLLEALIDYMKTKVITNDASLINLFNYGLPPRQLKLLRPLNLNFAVPYDKQIGFSVELQSVVGVGDESKYLQAIVSVCPPASVYKKKGFDAAFAFFKLDWTSTINELKFAEEPKQVTDVTLHRSSVVIFDIKAYDLKKEKIYNFGFAILPLAEKRDELLYLQSGVYKLPLFKGGPVPKNLLSKIEHEPNAVIEETVTDMIQNKELTLFGNGYVIAKVVDRQIEDHFKAVTETDAKYFILNTSPESMQPSNRSLIEVFGEANRDKVAGQAARKLVDLFPT